MKASTKILPALRQTLIRLLASVQCLFKCCINPQSLLTSLSAITVEKVSVVRKLVYAVGTLPYALTLNTIGFYFTVFLLDVALVRPSYST